jgi:hypothetical protein
LIANFCYSPPPVKDQARRPVHIRQYIHRPDPLKNTSARPDKIEKNGGVERCFAPNSPTNQMDRG